MDLNDLNKKIAEKVMGWTHKNRFYYIKADDPYPDYIEPSPLKGFKIPHWNPLENLNQCFEVVEKMEENGFYLKLRSPFIKPDDWQWWAYFEYHGTTDTRPLWSATAKTPNEAILKAVLRVIKEV